MIEATGIKIRNIACCIPAERVENNSHPHFPKEDVMHMAQQLGVRKRSVASPHTCASDYCQRAAEEVIQSRGIDRSEIGALVFVSQTPDYSLPATACILQEKLGLSQDTIAFDIGLGCSGYVYGLFMLQSLLMHSQRKYGLLLAGDTMARTVSEHDIVASLLLGDGGSATLLQRDDNAPAMHFDFGTDGSGWEHMHIPSGGCRMEYNHITSLPYVDADGITRTQEQLFLNTKALTDFTLTTVLPNLQDMKNNLPETDYYVLHQCNKPVLDALKHAMHIPDDRFLTSLADFGNTSSTSIPLTLCHRLAGVQQNTSLLVSGFGAGLSWGVGRLILQDTYIHEPVIL